MYLLVLIILYLLVLIIDSTAVDDVVSNTNNMDNPVYGVCDDMITAKFQPATATAANLTSSPGYDFDNPLYDMSEPQPLPVEPLPPQAAVYECIDDSMTNGSYATIGERQNGLTIDKQSSNLYDVI